MKGRFRSWLPQRVLQLIFVAFGVVVIVFFVMRLAPGDPARLTLGPTASQEAVDQLREDWGLNDNLLSQFVSFLGRLVRGDLGDSLLLGEPVWTIIWRRLQPTLLLVVMASLFALMMAVPLAMLAAYRRGTWIDATLRVGPVFGLAMPAVWVGLVLILVFGLNLEWFPVGGYGGSWANRVHSMVLPATTIAISMVAVLLRSVRASLVEILDADFIVLARLKEISRPRFVFHHLLLNALPPVITVFALNVGVLLGTTVIVERVFDTPGLGSLLVDSALGRDFPVVQGAALALALPVLVVYLLADVAMAALDPRIRMK